MEYELFPLGVFHQHPDAVRKAVTRLAEHLPTVCAGFEQSDKAVLRRRKVVGEAFITHKLKAGLLKSLQDLQVSRTDGGGVLSHGLLGLLPMTA